MAKRKPGPKAKKDKTHMEIKIDQASLDMAKDWMENSKLLSLQDHSIDSFITALRDDMDSLQALFNVRFSPSLEKLLDTFLSGSGNVGESLDELKKQEQGLMGQAKDLERVIKGIKAEINSNPNDLDLYKALVEKQDTMTSLKEEISKNIEKIANYSRMRDSQSARNKLVTELRKAGKKVIKRDPGSFVES